MLSFMISVIFHDQCYLSWSLLSFMITVIFHDQCYLSWSILSFMINVIFYNQCYPPLVGSIGWSPGFKLGDQTLNSLLTKVIFAIQGYPSYARLSASGGFNWLISLLTKYILHIQGYPSYPSISFISLSLTDRYPWS